MKITGRRGTGRERLDGIIWLPTGSGPSGRWCSMGPLGQGMGYGVHTRVKLSGVG